MNYDEQIRDMTIEEMKLWIVMCTGWYENIFNSMDDDKIKEVYRERVENRGQ